MRFTVRAQVWQNLCRRSRCCCRPSLVGDRSTRSSANCRHLTSDSSSALAYSLIYSGAKKYLVSHQLCKFSHLKRWERPVIFIIVTLQLWQTTWEKKSRKSHCRILNEFICKLWWKISIWSPTNKQDFWLSQTFFKRLLCPPLVTCINGTCLNLLSV